MRFDERNQIMLTTCQQTSMKVSFVGPACFLDVGAEIRSDFSSNVFVGQCSQLKSHQSM